MNQKCILGGDLKTVRPYAPVVLFFDQVKYNGLELDRALADEAQKSVLRGKVQAENLFIQELWLSTVTVDALTGVIVE